MKEKQKNLEKWRLSLINNHIPPSKMDAEGVSQRRRLGYREADAVGTVNPC